MTTPDDALTQIQRRLGLSPSPIDSLDAITSGRYLVTTEHGTRHVIDLDAKTSIRRGDTCREWDGRVFVPVPRATLPGTTPPIPVREDRITADGEEFAFTLIGGCSVGGCMRLDNEREWRITSMIVRIEAIGEEE